MFHLTPGGRALYRVLPAGPAVPAELILTVVRPDEGQSTEMELTLGAPEGDVLGEGRVELDKGYLGVVLEVRRQLDADGRWDGVREFDLVPAEERVDEDDASAAAGAGA
jgi:hypothetical protein